MKNLIPKGGKMTLDNYMDKIKTQLKTMTEREKDEWILAQVKIIPENKLEDVYKSLIGIKKIINMPGRDEIDKFCNMVATGDIVITYYTYYAEFSDGHYYGDWEYYYRDIQGAMDFILLVINGCYKLVILQEYQEAAEIFDQILKLKFLIEDDPESEDVCCEDYMDLYLANSEGLISIDKDWLLENYIKSYMCIIIDNTVLALKIVSILKMKLFEGCDISFIVKSRNNNLLNIVKDILEKDLVNLEKEYIEKQSEDEYYMGYYDDKQQIEYLKLLVIAFEEINL